MAVPTWTTGEVLAASDVNTWFVPTTAFKTSTQSVTSSTTLVNDTQLFVSVAANRTYQVFHRLLWTGTAGSSTPGLKYDWTFPSGASFLYDATGFSGTGSVFVGNFTGGSGSGNWSSSGNATSSNFGSTGVLTVAATAGTLQLQFAQLNSSATSTSVLAGSFLAILAIG